MSGQTVSTEVATQQEKKNTGPATMVKKYRGEFADVLPSHVKPETFVRVAVGALKKGDKDKQTGLTKLEQAAINNQPAFLSALLDAARLGLDPGTEQYYLVPFRNKKNRGLEEITGIPGYQGYIELMYRAGKISSVTVEVVRQSDTFRYSPNSMERPDHEIDWDAADRGDLRLVYAYAVMKDGSTSKVVVLNRAKIAEIKEYAQGASSDSSPWNNHAEAMWMKSAVRQLAKWVPTSREYLTETVQASAEIPRAQPTQQLPDWIEPAAEEVDGVVDGEVVEDEPPEPEPDADADQPASEPKSSEQQRSDITAAFTSIGIKDSKDRLNTLSTLVGRPATTISDLTELEATQVLDMLGRCLEADDPARALDSVITAVGEEPTA